MVASVVSERFVVGTATERGAFAPSEKRVKSLAFAMALVSVDSEAGEATSVEYEDRTAFMYRELMGMDSRVLESLVTLV